jgi:hypothetical protein
MSLPEFGFLNQSEAASAKSSGSSYNEPLRLTEDDRVCAYVSYSSILSKERRSSISC